jgi:Lrp/AsnC family transcriptional regulator for asnA, asnC and gidA
MIEHKHWRKYPRTTPEGKVKLDDIDDAILKILIEDSRTPILEIARRIYLSRGSVKSRLGQLIRSGVIKRFTIEIDRKKLADAGMHPKK